MNSRRTEKMTATPNLPFMAGERHGTVCAVIVSYCPELPRLQALRKSVAPQVGSVVVVDNGSPAATLAVLRGWAAEGAISLIEFGENRGIAAAHNAGIRAAMAQSFDYVLLLDHDSCLLPHCVAQLRQADCRLADAGVKVAAVGPQYVDATSAQPAPFWRFYHWTYRRIYARSAEDVIETSVLISSGSLVACATLQAVGLMDESLFIDGVDWEWCFRAAAHGYRLFAVAAAGMQHNLGDGGLRVLGRTLPLHGPLRHYYTYRNTVLMCGMAHVPRSWKWHFSLRLVARFCIYLALAPQRGARCRMIWRGLRDGLQGRQGRLASNDPK
jgi:rhamnosyltransferase